VGFWNVGVQMVALNYQAPTYYSYLLLLLLLLLLLSTATYGYITAHSLAFHDS